jgi:hypothetical protein
MAEPLPKAAVTPGKRRSRKLRELPGWPVISEFVGVMGDSDFPAQCGRVNSRFAVFIFLGYQSEKWQYPLGYLSYSSFQSFA